MDIKQLRWIDDTWNSIFDHVAMAL